MEVTKNKMTEQKDLVWDEEVDNLNESGNGLEYFKPDKGETKITFLDEGTVYTDQKKFDDSEREYVKFQIEVDGEKMIWDMAKGSTPNSKFGQIARYASSSNGLERETVTWFRQGSEQDTSHFLMDLKNVGEDSDEDSSDNVILDGDE